MRILWFTRLQNFALVFRSRLPHRWSWSRSKHLDKSRLCASRLTFFTSAVQFVISLTRFSNALVRAAFFSIGNWSLILSKSSWAVFWVLFARISLLSCLFDFAPRSIWFIWFMIMLTGGSRKLREKFRRNQLCIFCVSLDVDQWQRSLHGKV